MNRYAKLVAALVGLAAQALNAGLLHGTVAHWVTVGLAVATALGVYVVKNTPPAELDQLPGQIRQLAGSHQTMSDRLAEVEAIAHGLPTIAEYIKSGIVDGLNAAKGPANVPVPTAPEPAAAVAPEPGFAPVPPTAPATPEATPIPAV